MNPPFRPPNLKLPEDKIPTEALVQGVHARFELLHQVRGDRAAAGAGSTGIGQRLRERGCLLVDVAHALGGEHDDVAGRRLAQNQWPRQVKVVLEPRKVLLFKFDIFQFGLYFHSACLSGRLGRSCPDIGACILYVGKKPQNKNVLRIVHIKNLPTKNERPPSC